MKSKHFPFWLIAIALFIILIVREQFKDGMFMDGMIYTSVGKNLSHGLGTFWHPHFSKTAMSSYHEQPPLLYAIEAIFFWLLGDSMYTERVYGLLTALLTAFMISKVWSLIFKGEEQQQLRWLPVLFWLITPVCFWAYANNVEENTMGFFVSVAVYFILTAIKQDQKPYIYLTIAGVALILASMCKGVQGLFPLGAVFFYWLTNKQFSFKKVIRYTVFLVLIPTVFYALILLNETVYKSYEMYFNNRIVGTFKNIGATTGTRFSILGMLFSELLPVFALTVLLLAFFLKGDRLKKTPVKSRQLFLFFLILGFAGTLPLMVTYEQRGFYLVTAMPYFVLAFASICALPVLNFVNKIKPEKVSVLKRAAIALLIVAFVFSMWDMQRGPSRDKEMLNDVHLAVKLIPYGSVIGIDPVMWNEWALHAYFNRYGYVSLDGSAQKHMYYLSEKSTNTAPPLNYQKLELETQKYHLYKLK